MTNADRICRKDINARVYTHVAKYTYTHIALEMNISPRCSGTLHRIKDVHFRVFNAPEGKAWYSR